ncbi:MAG: T9SS type A sorting domain-containing protein, partial [Flavobacteriales bacterium]|nr:T9SS type A sorting domain-containing protein [Flavobacteriales bacterium]
TDGSWTLEDLNGNIISQGQGDFGYSTSKSFYVSQSTPSYILEEISPKFEILVYPNPFSKSTTVKIIDGKGPYQLEVFDLRGKIVKSFSFSEDEFQLDGVSTSSGIYWLKIKNQSNFKPIKLVIE